MIPIQPIAFVWFSYTFAFLVIDNIPAACVTVGGILFCKWIEELQDSIAFYKEVAFRCLDTLPY